MILKLFLDEVPTSAESALFSPKQTLARHQKPKVSQQLRRFSIANSKLGTSYHLLLDFSGSDTVALTEPSRSCNFSNPTSIFGTFYFSTFILPLDAGSPPQKPVEADGRFRRARRYRELKTPELKIKNMRATTCSTNAS